MDGLYLLILSKYTDKAGNFSEIFSEIFSNLTQLMNINNNAEVKIYSTSEEDFYFPSEEVPDDNPFGSMNIHPLLSVEESVIFKRILSTYGGIIMGGFGAVTNIINIIVFYRQGLKSDSCTLSLAALALIDFGVVFLYFSEGWLEFVSITLLKYGNYYADINLKVITTVIARPLPVLTQLTCWITAYISFERMVSVTFPFQAKTLLTPKRSFVLLSFILVVTFILHVPMMFRFHIKWADTYPFDGVFNLYQQPTWLNTSILPDIGRIINDGILRTLCILMVLIFNIVIIVKVNVSTKFKKSIVSAPTTANKKEIASHKNPKRLSSGVSSSKTKNNKETENKSREMKLIRMMIVMSIYFLFCYIPSGVIQTTIFLNYMRWIDLFEIMGFLYYDLLILVGVLGHFMEAFNSCFNIIIYITMSTRYRKELRQLCLLRNSKT